VKLSSRIALVSALALALAPLASNAHEDHCYDVFVLSGVDTGSARTGTNPGAATCTAHDPDVPVNTNTTVPGATHAWAAAFSTLPQPEGYVTINDGDEIELTFFKETVRDRWESNSVDLTGVAPGAVLKFTAIFDEDNVQTVTYIRL
jgi:hypothetical protein